MMHDTIRHRATRSLCGVLVSIGLMVPGAAQAGGTAASDALFAAIRTGDAPSVHAAIVGKADINARTEDGVTPVILATRNGHLDLINLLLDAGADPCAADNKGNTALMDATYRGDTASAQRLMVTACAIDQANAVGQTALMMAAQFNRVEIFNDLIDQGANLWAVDRTGRSVIAVATAKGNEAILDLVSEAKLVSEARQTAATRWWDMPSIP